jgi:fucose permease
MPYPGLGAFVAPLLSTHFATQSHWSYHYLVSMGLALINVLVLFGVFRLRRQEGTHFVLLQLLTKIRLVLIFTCFSTDIMEEAGIEPTEVEGSSTAVQSHYRQMALSPVLHYLAAFALIYVGTEVTLGGWIVTYIVRERKGGPSAGYISSGFFGGLGVGRIALIPLTKLVSSCSA